MTLQTSMWLGSEVGLALALRAESEIAATPKLELAALSGEILAQSEDADSGDEFGGYGYMVTKADNVAIVTVSGPLVTEDRPYNRYFGVVSYGEIRNAVYSAATKPGVEAVVMHYRTPGGSAAGIYDAGEFLKKVDAQIVPVYTFTDTSMTSGGYWLGSFGREIYASKLAVVGSIGVITIHASYAEMYKDAGIDVTVIRKGEFKALGSQFEKLDDKALAQIEGQMDAVYDAFLATVSENQGISVPTLLKTAAEGRLFTGDEGLSVGLVDYVESFDDAINSISKKAYQLADASGTRPINITQGTQIMAKMKVLTDAGVAAIAAGAPEVEVLQQDGMTAEVEGEATPEVKVDGEGEGGPADSGVKPVMDMGLLDKIGELQVTVAELKADKTASERALAAAEANVSSLVSIGVTATNRMQVALGGPAMRLNDVSAETLIETHSKVLGSFNQRFRAGAKAESMTDESEETQSSVMSDAASRLVLRN